MTPIHVISDGYTHILCLLKIFQGLVFNGKIKMDLLVLLMQSDSHIDILPH